RGGQRTFATVEVDSDILVELLTSLQHGGWRSMSGDVGGGDSHWSGLAQQFNGNWVQWHAQHYGATGIAKVPRKAWCLRNDDGQSTRPERLHKRFCLRRIGVHKSLNGVPAADEHWNGHIGTTVFGGQKVGYCLVVESVAAESIKG